MGKETETGREVSSGKEREVNTYMLSCNKAIRFDTFFCGWPNNSVPDIPEAFGANRFKASLRAVQ